MSFMSSTWGKHIQLSLFGESHGEGIGIVIDGLPAGLEIDFDKVDLEMRRRAPGHNPLGTPRKESDDYSILSGYFKQHTTGTPLTVLIKNKETASKDYSQMETLMRPGHGDYSGYMKYGGYNDYRGGGHFSGRLTAPIVFAGAVCRQMLERRQIYIHGEINQIRNLKSEGIRIENLDEKNRQAIKSLKFPSLDEAFALEASQVIMDAKAEKDSVGGKIELVVLNMPAGIGGPFFDSLESVLAHLIFSIPGVKGLAFGDGFDFASALGSEVKDEYGMKDGKVVGYANHNGGITGGISNGNIIRFEVAMKPTPSIGKPQRTIDMDQKLETMLEIEGRHDPCILPRALPVIEAMTAIALYELICAEERKHENLGGK